ncbi:hypothetical protein, partial [Salmonella sp. SAL4437]|uniref:hypothetical protein n=1 Tax=Salmonella sp. SAL4437 TaxID=3159892 RepID=UPI00397DF7DA
CDDHGHRREACDRREILERRYDPFDDPTDCCVDDRHELREVTEALQPLSDFLFRGGFFEMGDLSLHCMRDEFID